MTQAQLFQSLRNDTNGLPGPNPSNWECGPCRAAAARVGHREVVFIDVEVEEAREWDDSATVFDEEDEGTVVGG